MRVKGITNADMSRVVNETLRHRDWTYDGLSGTTHGILRHIPTGAVVTFGTTPGRSSWKTVANEVERVSGVVVWRKGSHKTSRRRVAASGYLNRATTSEHQVVAEREGLLEEYLRSADSLEALAGADHRSAVAEGRALVARMLDLEHRLQVLCVASPPGGWISERVA